MSRRERNRELAGAAELRRGGDVAQAFGEVGKRRELNDRGFSLSHAARVGWADGVEAAELIDEHDELERARDPGHLQDENLWRDHGDILGDPQERPFGELA